MYIARQPIFRTDLEVYGYELLFRGGEKSGGYDAVSGQQATAQVLVGFYEQGADRITEEKPAFVNFGDSIVETDISDLFDPVDIVVEILEDVKMTEEVVQIVKKLHERGFRIALDDFEEDVIGHPLMEYASIIKFDLIRTPLPTLTKKVADAKRIGKFLLAEKVETEEEFAVAKEMGFDLFQGYFFSKPKIVGQKNNALRTSFATYSLIVDELNREEPSLRRIADYIKLNVDLSYKLMRMISYRNADSEIKTIQLALAYLGLREINRWINILLLADISKSKPTELFRLSIVRSLFLDKLVMLNSKRSLKYEAQMTGLFSVVDAMTDMPMEEALQGIPLPDRVDRALLQHDGEISPYLTLIEAYEQGEMEQVDRLAKTLNLKSEDIVSAYLASLEEAHGLVKELRMI